MEVSVSFMPRLYVARRKCPCNTLSVRLVGPQAQSGHSAEEKSPLTVAEIEGMPCPTVVTRPFHL